MAKCKGCGAEIVWIKTTTGKSMPCNPEQVTYWQKAGAAGKVVTPNGEVISCEFTGDPNKATGIGYVPHWSTCPAAGSFKKPKKKKICDPGMCDECQYIGDGDFLCDKYVVLVVSDWEPTADYLVCERVGK